MGRDLRAIVGRHRHLALIDGDDIAVLGPGKRRRQHGVGGDHNVDADSVGRHRAVVFGQNHRRLDGTDTHITGNVQRLTVNPGGNIAANIVAHHQAPECRSAATGPADGTGDR